MIKKTLVAACLAAATFCAQAGETLRIAFFPAVAVTPVALAAESMPSVKFVGVDAVDMQGALLLDKADCGVMAVGDAVALYKKTSHQVRIVSGLTLDKEQERPYQRSVLACLASVEEKPVFVALTKSLFATLDRLRYQPANDELALDYAQRVINRTRMPANAEQLAERIGAAPNSNTGVAYSYLPRDVMYSAGAQGIETITKADDLLFDDLRAALKANKQTAY